MSEEFYRKWNLRWEKHKNSFRLKALYACNTDQIEFIDNSKIININNDDYEYVTFITFSYDNIEITFKREFEPRDYEYYWHDNDLIVGDYSSTVFDNGDGLLINMLSDFTFDDMLDELNESNIGGIDYNESKFRSF